MREEKAFLACGLIALVLISSFGAVNWRSKVGEWEFKASAGLVYNAILIYHIMSADNSEWVQAKELIENDNYSGAVVGLSSSENHLKSFADNIQFAKAFSLLQNKEVYDNLIQLAQNLANHIELLIENLQEGKVEQFFINQIDNDFENLYRLYFATFDEEVFQIIRVGSVWIVNNAGQMIDTKYIQYIWNIENIGA